MITIFLISFREFIEVFIIFQSFLTLLAQKKTSLYERTYVSGTIGFISTLIFTLLFFFVVNVFSIHIDEELFENIEGFMMIFSGGFIIMTVLVFHNVFHKKRGLIMKYISLLKPERKLFSIGIPFILFYLIMQEGIEIALFTSTTSVMNSLVENIAGLGMGLVFAGGIVHFTSSFLSKQFRSRIIFISEWLLILVGIYHVFYGITEKIS